MNIRLIFYLEQPSIISPSQLGFRKMRSTVDAIAKLETDILGAYSRKKHFSSSIFYIEKAYDTTWKYKILQKNMMME